MIHKTDLAPGAPADPNADEVKLITVSRDFKVYARNEQEAALVLDQQLEDMSAAVIAVRHIVMIMDRAAQENALAARRENDATSLPAVKDTGGKAYGPN